MRITLFSLCLLVIGCSPNTEPEACDTQEIILETQEIILEQQEIIIGDQPRNLKWVDFRNRYLWYTPESISTHDLNLYDQTYECNEIVLYLNDLMFTHTIDSTFYLTSMAEYPGTLTEPFWTWQYE